MATVTTATGGRVPYDRTNAAVGPARVLWTDLATAVPDDLYDVIPGVATAGGEYPPVTGWNDFGLAADAPQYTHDKDTEGLEYEQVAGSLFEQVTDIARSFTAQVGEISPETMKIVENASAIETIAAAAGKAAQKKVAFGVYSSFKQVRIAMVAFRPEGSGDVIEPAPSPVGSRPRAIGLILPRVSLAASGTDIEWSKSDPTNAEVEFTVLNEDTLDSGKEHGFWVFEDAGTILAV